MRRSELALAGASSAHVSAMRRSVMAVEVVNAATTRHVVRVSILGEHVDASQLIGKALGQSSFLAAAPMAATSRAVQLLRALLAAALLAAVGAAPRVTCFNKGELCARSFVYTPCCPGLRCDNPSGYDVNAVCKV